MNKLIGLLIIIGGLSGGYMLYQDYAAKEKERRNPSADEIRRVGVRISVVAVVDFPRYSSGAAHGKFPYKKLMFSRLIGVSAR